jgi:glycosyltransferase involved in cell wall biosynthesis
MPKYSIIVPVYNRPDEVDELLKSLLKQVYQDFEVLIIEDGSTHTCEKQVEQYAGQLNVRYYYKENSGQGFSRNYGFDRAAGEYFIVFDSDCIIPPDYLKHVDEALNHYHYDAFGGPDRAHPDFNPLQKAISYSMTSLFTTGGIRGREKRAGVFHPRSFNMGISREVYEATGGYKITRMGEDIEFSARIMASGCKVGLISSAFVFHKRRTTLKQFYRQVHFFGRARINIARFYPEELKLVHTFPAVFVIALLVYLLTPLISKPLFVLGTCLLLVYALLIVMDAARQTRSFYLAILSLAAAFVQLSGYGIGFITESFRKLFQG